MDAYAQLIKLIVRQIDFVIISVKMAMQPAPWKLFVVFLLVILSNFLNFIKSASHYLFFM